MKVFELSTKDILDIQKFPSVESMRDEVISEMLPEVEDLLSQIKSYHAFLNNGGSGDEVRCDAGKKMVRLAYARLKKVAEKVPSENPLIIC